MKKKNMEDFKKRKLELDEAGGDGDFSSKEELRFLIEPLAKPQLVDLLAKLCVFFSLPSSFLPHPIPFSAINSIMLFFHLVFGFGFIH